MRTRVQVLSNLLLLRLLPSFQAAQMNTLAITGVSVVDTTTGHISANMTVVVEGRVIAAAGEKVAAPRGARIVDGRGKFLIPGLWDMHTHHEGTGEASLPLFVANGVSGTRDMGSALDFILAVRQKTSSGRVLGPRIIAAGPILDDAPAEWPFRLRVRTASEARDAVRMLKRRCKPPPSTLHDTWDWNGRSAAFNEGSRRIWFCWRPIPFRTSQTSSASAPLCSTGSS